jgi:hypothetical protein
MEDNRMRNHVQFSIIPSRALDDVRLSASDIMVLTVLGLYTDKAGWCFPKLRTIAQHIPAPRRRKAIGDRHAFASTWFVARRIHHLEQCGYVHVVAQYNSVSRAQLSNGYQVLFNAELPAEFDRCALIQGARDAVPLSESHEYKKGAP